MALTTIWLLETLTQPLWIKSRLNIVCSRPIGKSFDITYVRLKFHTSRPESFTIFKRTREDGPWIPYQYYSGSCEKTYSKTNRGFIRTGEDEQQALCTDEFSDISPLTGGNVAFSTLEGRPSAYNFDNSPVLQVNTSLSRRSSNSPVRFKVKASLMSLDTTELSCGPDFQMCSVQQPSFSSSCFQSRLSNVVQFKTNNVSGLKMGESDLKWVVIKVCLCLLHCYWQGIQIIWMNY